MAYSLQKTLSIPFDKALQRVKEALGSEGFGVLTEIDMRETLKKKLNVDFRNYTILGACNPPFAYQALQVEDRIGLLLPCNVVVQETADGRVEAAAIDPTIADADGWQPEAHRDRCTGERKARQGHRGPVKEEKMGEDAALVKDVVCGMMIDPATAAAKRTYDGRDFFFCGKGCAASLRFQPRGLQPGRGVSAGMGQMLILKMGSTLPSLKSRKGDFEDWIITGPGPPCGRSRCHRRSRGRRAAAGERARGNCCDRLALHGHRTPGLERTGGRMAAGERARGGPRPRHLLRPPTAGTCPRRRGRRQPERARVRHGGGCTRRGRPGGRAAGRPSPTWSACTSATPSQS